MSECQQIKSLLTVGVWVWRGTNIRSSQRSNVFEAETSEAKSWTCRCFLTQPAAGLASGFFTNCFNETVWTDPSQTRPPAAFTVTTSLFVHSLCGSSSVWHRHVWVFKKKKKQVFKKLFLSPSEKQQVVSLSEAPLSCLLVQTRFTVADLCNLLKTVAPLRDPQNPNSTPKPLETRSGSWNPLKDS